MQRLEVSGVVRPIDGSLGVKGLKTLSDLHRYVELMLWQRVLCIV